LGRKAPKIAPAGLRIEPPIAYFWIMGRTTVRMLEKAGRLSGGN
jgi:hypothetical protein